MTRCLVHNKNIYNTQTKAQEAAEKAEEKRGVPLRTYYCGACGGYHLTRRVTLLAQLHEGEQARLNSNVSLRSTRIKRGKQICAANLPREEHEMKAMFDEVESLRSLLVEDLKIVRDMTEEDDVKAALGELRTRRDALKFVMKKLKKDQLLISNDKSSVGGKAYKDS